MTTTKKYKKVLFKDMKIGDEGECWGDYISGQYECATWVRCKKDSEHGVTIIAVNDIPKNDGGVCVSDNEEFQVEIK